MSELAYVDAKRPRGRPLGSKTKSKKSASPKLKHSEIRLVAQIEQSQPASPPLLANQPNSSVCQNTLIEQVQLTVRSGNRLSGWVGRILGVVGLVLGAFVPLATYSVGHFELDERPWLWLLVLGGLAYSAMTVYKWAHTAFHFRAKAIGFVILLEGTMTFSHIRWLGLSGLVILMVLNGVSAAAALREKKEAICAI